MFRTQLEVFIAIVIFSLCLSCGWLFESAQILISSSITLGLMSSLSSGMYEFEMLLINTVETCEGNEL